MMYKLLFALCHYGALILSWYGSLQLDISAKWGSSDYLLVVFTLLVTAYLLAGVISSNSAKPPEKPPKDPPDTPLIPVNQGA